MFFCFLIIRIRPCRKRTVPDIKRVAIIGIWSQNKKIYDVPHMAPTIPIIISEVEKRSTPPSMVEVKPNTTIPFLVLHCTKVKVPVRMKAMPRTQNSIKSNVPKEIGAPNMKNKGNKLYINIIIPIKISTSPCNFLFSLCSILTYNLYITIQRVRRNLIWLENKTISWKRSA